MGIERRGVVGLLEIQASGEARNVVDDHELTEILRTDEGLDRSLCSSIIKGRIAFVSKKRGLSICTLAHLITNKSYLNTKLNASIQRPILDGPKRN